MKLHDAIPILLRIQRRKFKELYSDSELSNIITAKGDTGKLLEKILGLPPGNTLKDFEDGELKTNKTDELGRPKETMFITQISTRIDELLEKKQFSNSWLLKKIERLLYVPVVKVSSDPREWYFLEHTFLEITKDSIVYEHLKNDYYSICTKMIEDITLGDGFIHTSSGKYIQIRTKDAKPYNPIFSKKFMKEISNKNFAFYFKKEFMLDFKFFH